MNAFEGLVQDIRFGLRTLRGNPGFTALAIVTLALGIGANTAIFSVINGVLLRPLPYRDPDQLVLLQQRAPGAGFDALPFSIKEVVDYRDELQTLDSVVEYHSMSFTLLSHGEPDRVLTGVVSHDFFEMLGVPPLHGRSFTAEDEVLDADAVLMLSHEYWQQRFGGDPGIVGEVFEMNDRPHTVVGVLPPFPQYPRDNDVYMPTVACPFRANGERVMHENRAAFRALSAFGRLAPDATLANATADVATVAARFQSSYPETYDEGSGFAAQPVALFEELTAGARPMLLVLLGTSGLVLLIACANVANLTLSRMMRRERELAVRTAMGAGRGRLLAQLVTESTLLALAGGVLGLLLAGQGIEVLTRFVANFTPRVQQIAVDGWVLAFTLGVSVLTGVFFGSVPALSSRTDLVTSLKDGGNQSTSSGYRQRLRGALIVGQVAVSFTLLIGAGLMLSSFYKLSRVDVGFDAESVVTAEMFPNWSKYTDDVSRRRLFTGVLERLESGPGVSAAAIATGLPLVADFGRPQPFEIEGATYESPALRPQVRIRNVTPAYFRAIGVPLLAGRELAATDDEDGLPVAVINRTLAEANWREDNPVGKRLSFDGGQSWVEVVGVIGDVRQQAIDRDPEGEIYFPALQSGNFGGYVVVRGNAAPAAVAAAVRDAVHGVDPEQPVENFRTLGEIRSGALATPRLTAILLGLFGGIALAITLVGITGVIATSVSQRLPEFGIRMAIGAQASEVMAMVLRQGLMLVAAGLAIGVAGALLLGRALSGMLYETAPADPATFMVVGLLFAIAGALACLTPARRATAVDPIVALRNE
jgi:putative ABC transport system permease protein